MQFEEICRENYARIYNYILARTADREAAEDLTQDVFLIAFRKGEAFLCHEKPAAFLYVTAKNLVLEYYKKPKETGLNESKNISFGRDAFEELCLQRSDSVNENDYRRQVLWQLKPGERDFYRKYYIDKKPMKEIARECRMSEAAVRMKYMRIRQKLRKIVAGLKLDDF